MPDRKTTVTCCGDCCFVTERIDYTKPLELDRPKVTNHCRIDPHDRQVYLFLHQVQPWCRLQEGPWTVQFERKSK